MVAKMPKDDWAKYARRDRGRRGVRRAFRKGEVAQTFEELVTAANKPSKKAQRHVRREKAPKPPRERKHRAVRLTQNGFTIDYLGTPESAQVRIVVQGDLTRPIPHWPGF